MTTRSWPLDMPAETLARLHTDHQRVRALFQHYEHSRDPQLRQQIANQVCVALELQALLEDPRFSPPGAGETGQADDTLDADARATSQHIQQVMSNVRDCDPQDVLFDVHFHDLMDAVSQYMEEAAYAPLLHAAAQRGER